MNDQAPWTVLRLLEWTTQYLRDHQSSSPRLDAEVLLAKAMMCQRIELYTSFDKVAEDSVRSNFRELVRRRADGVPVAYLVGEKEFYSRPFHVTPDVLIPRPETEFIIVQMLDRVGSNRKSASPTICDVGTGSGILAVTAATELPAANVTAVDTSAAALDVARQNARRHHVEDRIRFQQSDLFERLSEPLRFDFILTNPPYISESEFAQLDPTVRQFEPHLALLAGPTGFEVIDRILQAAPQRLKPGGWLILEISPMLKASVVERIQADSRLTNDSVCNDLAQQARVVSVQLR